MKIGAKGQWRNLGVKRCSGLRGNIRSKGGFLGRRRKRRAGHNPKPGNRTKKEFRVVVSCGYSQINGNACDAAPELPGGGQTSVNPTVWLSGWIRDRAGMGRDPPPGREDLVHVAALDVEGLQQDVRGRQDGALRGWGESLPSPFAVVANYEGAL